MKTREQIYAREAGALLRDISMYRVLTEEQIQRLHPSKSVRGRERVRNLLTYLVKQQRVWLSEDEQFYLASPDALENMDRGLFAAVWVLADFMDQVEYHSVGDYPAKIIFFADGEVYEIVHAAQGKEVLVSHVLSSSGERPSHYLVLVDDPGQIEELQIPHANGYCTVTPVGEVQYYQKE